VIKNGEGCTQIPERSILRKKTEAINSAKELFRAEPD